MPLFQVLPVDTIKVQEIVKEHWNADLGALVKESQNHTFLALREEEKLIVRVTPDPESERVHNTELELRLLAFLEKNELPVCTALPSVKTGELLVRVESFNISVFRFASGEPVAFQEWKWMTEESQVVGLGRWFAQLHRLIPLFIQENPSLSEHARHWTELHDGVLKDVPVHEEDQKTIDSPEHFSIIHGDVNPSNYHWDPVRQMPCMFDWDQLQRCWLLYDLSAPIFTVVTLEGMGSPIDFSPVPQANVQQFTDWIVKGYETESNKTVDRESLKRMLEIRRQLYKRFCARAVLELPSDSFMGKFCNAIHNWLNPGNESS